MKIKCLLVDDEPLAIRLLQNHLRQFDSFEVVASCPDAIKAHEILNVKTIDLMFLDIKMPKISGIEFLKTLRNPPKTILTTAYREFALDGYDLEVIDYLLKPITFDRFLKAIDRFLRQNNSAMPSMQPVPGNAYLNIKSGNKYQKINTDDILYIESVRDYIKIVTTEKEIIAKYKISDIETEVCNKGFLRIHRSFIISTKKITAFSATGIELGKVEIPVGASYKEVLKKAMGFK